MAEQHSLSLTRLTQSPVRRKTMNQDKPIDPKGTSPDDLTKTTKKGNVELSEEELKKASGGAVDYFLKFGEDVGESSTTNKTTTTKATITFLKPF